VNELTTHIWWPTLIWFTDMLDEEKLVLKDMKKYILDMKKNDTIGVIKSNNGGWQSQTYLEWPEQFELFSNKLDENIKICSEQMGLPELKLNNFWCNINTFGDYNKLHNHHHSILSGTFYVDVPDKNMGKINFVRADDIEYYLPELDNYNSINGEIASYTPESGRLIMFPSWVKHSVDGCRSKKNRIGISFNYGV